MGSAYFWAALAAGAADAIAMPLWAGSSPRPDVGLVILALAALPGARGEATWGRAFAVGLAKDLFSALPPGVFALCGLALALLFAWHGRSFRLDHPLWRAGVCGAGAAVVASLGGGPGAAVWTGIATAVVSLAAWIGVRSSSSSPSC